MNGTPDGMEPAELATLRKSFRRCSQETIEAIFRFRQDRDPDRIAAIARGIVLRYLSEAGREAMGRATEETSFAELAIESLTMFEIVMDIQDALDIEIADAELRSLATLGDLMRLLREKVAAGR
jgi:acyl carrier protein